MADTNTLFLGMTHQAARIVIDALASTPLPLKVSLPLIQDFERQIQIQLAREEVERTQGPQEPEEQQEQQEPAPEPPAAVHVESPE